VVAHTPHALLHLQQLPCCSTPNTQRAHTPIVAPS